MGRDGLRGVEALKAAGGSAIVQDEATSVVWGMPGAVAEAGLADCILPLDAIAPELVRRAGGGSHTEASNSMFPLRAQPPITAETYAYLERYIYDATGIALGRDKQYLLESRLLPVVGMSIWLPSTNSPAGCARGRRRTCAGASPKA